MQVYPEKYDQLELSAEEKSFLRTLDRSFSNESLAYYILHINPRKIAEENGTGAELFNLLVVSQGILLFRFLTPPNLEVAQLMIRSISTPQVFAVLDNDIKCRLEESRYLTDKTKELKYALSLYFVIPAIDGESILSRLSANEREFCKNHILFQDDIQRIRKKELGIDSLISPLETITEDVVNSIFQRLCPEITIPRKFFIDENVDGLAVDSTISNADRSVQSYRLDDRQINIVNKISKGNQLILACAGSGKSVLLISKCFKLASLNPTESFLLTCYNRNLYNYYQWAIAIAGFTDRNVKCVSFFGLCKQLLENNRLSVPRGNYDDDHYNRIFLAANNALAHNQIKDRYLGIFIDEVQIFKPEWYRFCFNLLRNRKAEEHFFVIAGDKSQDIKNNIKHSRAPWQGGGAEYPEYRGKTLPIEINYRNSKPINDAIDRFVTAAKKLGTDIGADLMSDPELFLRGTAYRPGNNPRLIELDDYSNEGEAKVICDEIRRLLSIGYSEVDIAIILYNKHTKYTSSGWKTHYYHLLPGIKSAFFKEGWEAPAILISGEASGATYGSRRGVTIATIEGALGLDFQAVILAGLRPLGMHEKARSMGDFQSISAEKLEDKIEAFKKNINYLYTGCTRAKDELSVILSEKPGKSVYLDLIRESMRSEEQ